MSTSRAKTIEEANHVLIVRGDGGSAEQYFTPEYVAHTRERDLTGGAAGVRAYVDMVRGAFSDLEVEVEILVEAGDRVAWQRTVSGTHTGDFRGFPATGRRTAWRDMLVSRFRDGLIEEEWVVSDMLEALLLARKGGGR